MIVIRPAWLGIFFVAGVLASASTLLADQTPAASRARPARGDGAGTGQGRGSGSLPTPPPPPPKSASPVSGADNAAAGSHIQERSVTLSRTQIDTTSRQLAANAPKRSGGLLGGLKTSLSGDEHREDAARMLLEAVASQEAGRGSSVVVVIGSDEDRVKVRDSLAEVQRDVVLMFVDDGLSDDTTDNSALHGGLAGKVKGTATNLWVYMPSSGSGTSRKPNQTLSVKVATPKLWVGVFGANGDLPVQATNALDNVGTSRSADPAPASAAPGAKPALAAGDVLSAKIAGVKLVAQPADSAKVVATLAKGDEVIVTGAEKSGFVQVQGAAGSGWVNVLFMTRQP